MKSSTDKSNGLMGDLESIKALLEEDELEAVPESLSEALNPLPEVEELTEVAPEETSPDAATTDAALDEDTATEIDTPIVQEPIQSFDPATGLSEPILSDALLSEARPAKPLAETKLEDLLSDDFHDATAEVMQRARGLINQHANNWSPQQTDDLANALRVRIDEAVASWIKVSLDAHALELQQRLLNAVRDELARHLEAFEHSSE